MQGPGNRKRDIRAIEVGIPSFTENGFVFGIALLVSYTHSDTVQSIRVAVARVCAREIDSIQIGYNTNTTAMSMRFIGDVTHY